MESNNFSVLENRKLIDYLIGEKESKTVLPYLSESKIQELALTFGIFLSEDDKRMSRWMQFE